MSAPLKEILKNNPTTTLNGNITNSATSIVVTAGSVFPSTGNFRLICESEIMLCTARSTNTLTVTRGAEGTSAVAHNTLTPISQVLTLGAVEAYGRDNDPMWASNRPALGKLVNDAGTTILTSSDFTAVNLGSGTVTDENGTILVRRPGHVGNSVHALVRTSPSTPYSYIAAFQAMTPLGAATVDRPNFGMCFRESGTGKLITFEHSVEAAQALNWRISTFTSPTSGTTTSAVSRMPYVGPVLWMKLQDDGTDLKYHLSVDGFNWIQVFSAGRTAHMAGGPDQVGWFVNNYENSVDILARLCHWSKE